MFQLWMACLATFVLTTSAQQPKPNIILFLADDLGYGELGSYGQKLIQTPNLDRLAAEGMRFTQFYAGNTVCAPSRSVLMTGLHMGHTRVRGNAGANNSVAQMLYASDRTVARVLREAGYATGLVGKWGLGLANDEGEPRRQGFDSFYGFLSQTQAHNHYPNFLWRDGERVALPNDLTQVGAVEGTGYSTTRLVYAGDRFAEESREFVQRNRDKPFFLFISSIAPHANNERARSLGEGSEVPDVGIYADRPWNDSQKNHAAMVTRLDRDVGELMALLRRLELDEKTLVLFSSDNGPHREAGTNYNPELFTASGPLNGIKRSLTEGGIRVPFIARWPGRIAPGSVSSHPGYFGDLMATFTELAGVASPPNLDSISLVPTLLGKGEQRRHEYFYWEFYEMGINQAVLLDGHWKGIRLRTTSAPIQLFDLENDLGEKTNLAASQPVMVERVERIMREAHVDNDHWKIPAPTAAPAPARAP